MILLASDLTCNGQDSLIDSGREQAIIALARGNVYNLLASIYGSAPSPRVIAAIVDGTLPQALRDAGLDHLAHDLEVHAQGRDCQELLHELEVEYARLFTVPGPGSVPLYQSLYCDEGDGNGEERTHERNRFDKRQLWGEAAVAAQRMYREAGLAVSGDLPEIPDHIALELQFMHHLCSREAQALNANHIEAAEESVRLQKAFAQARLIPWVERFCQTLRDTTDHPFYTAMADLTVAFVLGDAVELQAGPDDAASTAEQCPVAPLIAW